MNIGLLWGTGRESWRLIEFFGYEQMRLFWRIVAVGWAGRPVVRVPAKDTTRRLDALAVDRPIHCFFFFVQFQSTHISPGGILDYRLIWA
jgi:hypothetical protein